MQLPEDFTQSLQKQFDQATNQDLLDVIQNQKPPTSIRVNPEKCSSPPQLERIPWCKTGYYLPERPIFTKDPFFHAGGYYVQEASSMVLEEIIQQTRPDQPIRVLDLCAAPGGKSTHILSLLKKQDLLVSNEVIRSRAATLQENITKWGSDQCIVTNSDPRHFAELEGFFDVMMVDAPCSGEGMFRKDTEAIAEWSKANVSLCYERQQRILTAAWDALAYGGTLIYSTCTFNQTENEQVLEWLIKNFHVEPASLSFPDPYGFLSYTVDDFTGYKLLPGRVKGEGYSFFAVTKSDGPDRWESTFSKRKEKKKDSKRPQKKIPLPGIKESEELTILDWDNNLLGTRFEKELGYLKQYLNVLKSGVMIGEVKKNKVVPSHELAQSRLIEKAAWPAIELDYYQALHYLMKAPFELDASQRGFHLVTFKETILGWINHLGNRFNNLYPGNWRIQRDFRNEEPFSILLQKNSS